MSQEIKEEPSNSFETQPFDVTKFKFNPLKATAIDLQEFLRNGTLTSVEVIDVYLRTIKEYNHRLHAVIQTAPLHLLKKCAEKLDQERKDGHERGPLHGIPVLVKDNTNTDPHTTGLGTTCGSFSLLHSKPKGNAVVVEGLVKAGAIILGKANLSEFSYSLGENLPCGWSAVGGYTQSAYVKTGLDRTGPVAGNTACLPAWRFDSSSSSGSAVAVSAGFAPVSLGTETCGSLIAPANRAALYTIKPSIGLVPGEGIVPISDFCDAAGPMTKNVADLANVLEAIVDPGQVSRIPKGGYASAMVQGWKGIRVGCVDVEKWMPEEKMYGKDDVFIAQQQAAIRDAYKTIDQLGAEVVYSVDLISPDKLKVGETNMLFDMWGGNYRRLIDKYLASLNSSNVRSMKEIVEFNKSYEYIQLPPGINQNKLEKALEKTWSMERTEEAVAYCHKIGRDQGIDLTLERYGVDVIIGPADSALVVLVSASGYPVISLPLSTYDGNGRPFGLVALAGRWQEALLIKVASAWEATFPARVIPDLEALEF